MNENVENLVLEQFRAMRTENGKILVEVRSLRSEMIAVRHHVRGVETLQDQQHDDIARMKVGLDRIEQRLEISASEGA